MSAAAAHATITAGRGLPVAYAVAGSTSEASTDPRDTYLVAQTVKTNTITAGRTAAAGAAASGLNRIARSTLATPLAMSSAATRIPAFTPDVRRTLAAPR